MGGRQRQLDYAAHDPARLMTLRVPKKIYNRWGEEAGEMFSFLADALQARGFRGPLYWKEAAMVPFAIDVTDKIRLFLTLSTAGGSQTETFFDSALIILSKRLAENTLPSEPWWAVHTEEEFAGYLPCMVLRLSHMKWAAAPSDHNPAWVSSRAGAARWLEDFDALLRPVVKQLRSDYDLAKLMWDAIHYERPAWVLSDAPASAMFFRERFMALQRFPTAISGSEAGC
jgi:hypothetical protein